MMKSVSTAIALFFLLLDFGYFLIIHSNNIYNINYSKVFANTSTRSTEKLNYIPNSSFEVGITEWHISINNFGSNVEVINDKTAPHGVDVLKVELPNNQPQKSTLRLSGPWITLDPRDGIYELSLWARSDHPDDRLQLSIFNAVDQRLLRKSMIRHWALSKTFTLNSRWKRYAIQGKLDPSYLESYRPIIRISGNGAEVYIDAISLRPYSSDTTFVTAEKVAMGMGTQDPLNIIVFGDEVRPFVALYSEKPGCRPSKLSMTIQASNSNTVFNKNWRLVWSASGHCRVESHLYGRKPVTGGHQAPPQS